MQSNLRAWSIVGATFFSMLVLWGAYYAYSVFFKPMMHDFGWTRAETAGAITISIMIRGISSLWVGSLSDRFGAGRVIPLCGLLIGISYVLTSRINSLLELYIYYGVLLGIGYGGAYVPFVTAITRWFSRRRGLALGISVAGIGVGTSLFPPLSQFIISGWGWREAFVATGIITGFITIIAGLVIKSPEGREEERVEDVSLKTAIRTGTFWMFFMVYIFYTLCLQMVMMHLVNYATDVGIDPESASLIFVALGIASFMGRIAMGWVADRIGARGALLISLSIFSLSTLSLNFINKLVLFFIFAFLFGFSYGGMIPQFPSLSENLFGGRHLGSIFGAFSIAAAIGGASGPVIGGFIFDITGSYYSAFFLAGGLSILALIITSILRGPEWR